MNAIVLTTIHEPTEAILRFAKMHDWKFYVVGDKKTPHESYMNTSSNYGEDVNWLYLTPTEQEVINKPLSDFIGWNTTARRVMGIVQAYRDGAEIIALVDDDNVPLDNWGKNVKVGKKFCGVQYQTHEPVFDPLYAYKFWHRGFPPLLERDVTTVVIPELLDVLVQADLWLGAADTDAICNIMLENCNINKIDADTVGYFSCKTISPFNSQNTFLHRLIIPDYWFLPRVGRMDDIWASFMLQKKYPGCVVYGPPSVYQKRNPHNYIKDLEDEMLGYKHSLDLIRGTYTPPELDQFVELYQKALKV